MVYLAGIDTLYVGYNLKEITLSQEVCNDLINAKEQARASVFKTAGYHLNFQGIDFTVSPAGKKPYTYVLYNDDFTVKLAQKVSHGIFPEVFIELRSQLLWRLGYRHTYTFIKDWLSKWAKIKDDVVSRADLSVDVQGFPHIAIENIVSRARKGKAHLQLVPVQQGQIYYYSSKIQGWVFGSGPLMLRIYNKRLECRQVRKEWFEELWEKGGWNGTSDITRVEMQLRRDFLKDFNVTTFASFEESLGDIFRYLTQDWFTVRSQKGKNRSRWPIAPFWAEVQSALDQFGKIFGLARGKIKDEKCFNLIPQAAGLLTSLAAAGDYTDLSETLSVLQNHFKSQGQTFEEEVSEKRQKLTLFEDGYEPF